MKIMKTVLVLITCLSATCAFAELQELDEKELEEQTAKEGITIDMAFKWKIGEIYFDYGRESSKTPTIQASPDPHPASVIDYVLPD